MKKNRAILYLFIAILIGYIAVALAYIHRLESQKDYDKSLYLQVQKEYNEIGKISNITNEELKVLENVKTDLVSSSVIGKIRIDKINLEYPILFETTDELLKIAPTRYCGPAPNGIGNLVIIGHNYYDGTHFSNLNQLKIGDKVVITDNTNYSCTYKVYDKEIISPTDFSFIENNKYKTESFVTLVTCINGLSNRLIIKCKEV